MGKDPEQAIAPPPKIRRGPLTYDQRDEALRAMGFSNYKAYLNSSLWKGIRARVFRARGRRCWICRRRKAAKQIHHEYYTAENLSGKGLSGLRPICPPCHHMIEYTSGKKLTNRQSRKKSSALRRGTRKIKRRRAKWVEQAAQSPQDEMRTELERLLARDS